MAELTPTNTACVGLELVEPTVFSLHGPLTCGSMHDRSPDPLKSKQFTASRGISNKFCMQLNNVVKLDCFMIDVPVLYICFVQCKYDP